MLTAMISLQVLRSWDWRNRWGEWDSSGYICWIWQCWSHTSVQPEACGRRKESKRGQWQQTHVQVSNTQTEVWMLLCGLVVFYFSPSAVKIVNETGGFFVLNLHLLSILLCLTQEGICKGWKLLFYFGKKKKVWVFRVCYRQWFLP